MRTNVEQRVRMKKPELTNSELVIRFTHSTRKAATRMHGKRNSCRTLGLPSIRAERKTLCVDIKSLIRALRFSGPLCFDVELKTYISCYFIFISTCASEFTHKATLNGALRKREKRLNQFCAGYILAFVRSFIRFQFKSEIDATRLPQLGISSEYDAQSISNSFTCV